MNEYAVVLTPVLAALSTWTLNVYFQTFLDRGKSCRLNWVRWSIFFMWQIIAALDILKIPAGVILFINILTSFLVSFNYASGIFQKAVFTVLYHSIWMLMEIYVINIFYAVRLDVAAYKAVAFVLSDIVLLIVVKALERFFCNEQIRELPQSYNMALMVIPVGSMFVVYHSFMMSTHGHNIWHMISSFAALWIMLVMNVLIFTIYLKLSEDLELKQKNMLYEQQLDLYHKYLEEKENTMAELRKIRHNLKNQFIYLMELTRSRDYSEMEDFLKRLIETEPFDHMTVAKTDNPVVDALVNYKYAISQKYNIEFDVKLDVPICLPFASSDLCIILGNALDNALEANIRSDIEKPYIKLIMRMDVRNLIILIKNSFNGEIRQEREGKILTVKSDRINHGIGLASIQKAVEKYHGFMKIDYSGNEFKLKIVLYEELS